MEMENKGDTLKLVKKEVEKAARAALLINAVFESNGDIYDEPCKKNEDKYNNFVKAIEILSDLKEKGKCDFEYDDIETEYTIHAIHIKWVLDDGFDLYIDDSNKNEIKMLLDYTEECLISDDDASSWQLTSVIYEPA